MIGIITMIVNCTTGLEGKSRSSSFTETSSKTEAALRAQLIELRRDLSNSQQEVEKTKLDLQQRQELLRSAAGRTKYLIFLPHP